jgi:K+-transporting ATPase ATPase C chain
MQAHLRPALTVFALLTLLTGFVYPAFVTIIAQGIFSREANGSVLMRDGKAIGSGLIGQPFDDPRYFWGRPSATEKVAYNAASSGGSNLGPTNPALLEAVSQRIEAIRKAHPDQSGPIPLDLVTTSASGLDPHISRATAEYQIARVAKVRGLSTDAVRQLVSKQTESRTFGVLGESRVHVLKLNLALDEFERAGAPANPVRRAGEPVDSRSPPPS